LQPSPGDATGLFERRDYAAGQPIDWPHGVFFMDVETGAIEAWRATLSGAFQTPSYDVQWGGRFVTAWAIPREGLSESQQLLLDRQTGKAAAFRASVAMVVAAARDLFVFEFSAGTAGRIPPFGTGRFVITNPDLGEIGRFETTASQFWTIARVSHDSKSIAVWSAPQGEAGTLYIVDVASGTARPAFTPGEPERNRWLARPTRCELSPDGQAIVSVFAFVQPRTLEDQKREQPEATFLDIRRWDGTQILTREAPGLASISLSPSFEMAALERTSLFAGDGGGESGGERWTDVVMESVSGEPLMRVRSASLNYGDLLSYDRWLADSSGFVAQIAGPGPEGIGYAIVRVDGSAPRIERLPLPPSRRTGWFGRDAFRGPLPSPFRRGLFSFGRLDLYDQDRDRWLQANVIGDEGPSHLDPWCGRPGEMVFGWPHGGHGTASPPIFVQPAVDPPPFDEPMRFTVAGTGSCLNIRSQPGPGSPVLTCAPERSLLDLRPESPSDERKWPRSAQRTDSGLWVRVRTSDGIEGWASGEYLAWAPGSVGAAG
jgi:hypothetical protein